MEEKNSRRLVLLEASKVNNQHSTLVDGVLRSYLYNRKPNQLPPILYAHPSLFDNLSTESKRGTEFRPISVMDPQKRRLARKSLLEFFVTIYALWKLNTKHEFLLVTTLLPSAGILVEIFKWFFPSKAMAVMVHGDLEGILDKSRHGFGSYGRYMKIWFKIRGFYSKLYLAVIDQFIADFAIYHFSSAVRPDQIFVVPLLVEAVELDGIPPKTIEEDRIKCCFIGFDTPNKGYSQFQRLVGEIPDVDFYTIGAGRQLNERTGDVLPLRTYSSFMNAIAACDISIFPYLGGYNCSLSAAATDALAAGTHVLATARPCFVALQQEFGLEAVTICNEGEDFRSFLNSEIWLQTCRFGRSERLSLLSKSRYSLESVSTYLADMLERQPLGEMKNSHNRSIQ